MKTHFADRLLEAVQQKQVPACVGLDPLVERFPAKLLREHHIATTEDGHIEPGTPGEKITAALGHFGREVLRTIAPLVPVVKINIAFFERYYADGIRVYGELVRCAHELGLLVIGDVKRADIGHSATQYAHAHLGEIPPWVGTGILNPDAVTVNPYFGFDAIRPFVEVGMGSGRGLFVLVQTSNESAPEIQDLALADGSTVSEHVARRVHAWSAEGDRLGVCGYRLIGAVVSPRDAASTARLRALMPHAVFLVPGFGAQGRTVEDVAPCFKPDGTGALVTASRSVIYAHADAPYRDRFGDDWVRCLEAGCAAFVEALQGLRGR